MANKDTFAVNGLDKLFVRDFREDLEAHDNALNSIPVDALEAMESAKVFDLKSKQTENKLTDSMTDTIYRERAARVVGQLPEGEVKAIGKKDTGKSLFMDLIRTKYIYPNANAQRSLKQKLYMWKKKTSVYNSVAMYYDSNTDPKGYEGPDCWLWNPRNFIPQNGKVSRNDMDYCHALAYWSPRQFQDLLDDPNSGYDKAVLKELMPVIKEATDSRDPQRKTKQNKDTSFQTARQVKVVTRYEAGWDGRWITFLPDFGHSVIKDVANPHLKENPSGIPLIPFVILTGEPEFDSYYGTSDYARSMPMQSANDGTWNVMFQNANKMLNPRTFAHTTSLVAHTWRNDPGALVEFNGPISVKTEDVSTAALSTFQALQGVVKGALQTAAGTTDTRSNAQNASDPGFSKTPEGLRQISEREATRDKQDRDTFEEACKELMDGMLSLIPIMGKKIPIDIWENEIEEIMQTNPDLAEIVGYEVNGQRYAPGQLPGDNQDDPNATPITKMQDVLQQSKDNGTISVRPSESGQQMRLRIYPEKLKGLQYRFELEPNSTAAKTKESQLNAFKDFFAFLGTIQNVVQEYQSATGQMIDLSAITKTFGSLSDVPGMDDLFTKAPEKPQQEQQASPKELLNYKDAPDDIKRQMEAAAGFTPSQQAGTSNASPTQTPEQKLQAAHELATNSPVPPAPQDVGNDPHIQQYKQQILSAVGR